MTMTVSRAALEYLFLGYAIIWVAIFAYVMMMVRRQKTLVGELKLLKQAIAGQGAKGSGFKK